MNLASSRDPLIFAAGAFQPAFYALMTHGTANQVSFVLSRVTRGLSTRWSQLPAMDERQKRSRSSREHGRGLAECRGWRVVK